MAERESDVASIVLFYLARGADEGYLDGVQRFAQAYRSVPAGVAHRFVVILKGFPSAGSMDAVRNAFAGIPFEEVCTSDDSFDLGAYRDAVGQINCDRAAFLNTNSEPLSSSWLAKLNAALDLDGVGLVGASGSFEQGVGGCTFPNVHVRTNAFMMGCGLARELLGAMQLTDKRSAHLAEHGVGSLTREVVRRGLSVRIVGANGRAYAPEWWSGSRTFRQSNQANLLIADNQTRAWDRMSWPERKVVHDATWGVERMPAQPFLDPCS